MDAELIYEILKKIKLKFFNWLIYCCVYMHVCRELTKKWSVKKTEMFYHFENKMCYSVIFVHISLKLQVDIIWFNVNEG